MVGSLSGVNLLVGAGDATGFGAGRVCEGRAAAHALFHVHVPYQCVDADNSVRAVVWKFMTEVWRVVCVNASMLLTSLKMYQVALRSPRLQKLPGSTFAFASWGALISVLALALKKNKDMYGKYGRMMRAWWTAVSITFYDYLPGAATKTKASVTR
ncbi:hypothetical protein JG687_00019041 [Phytophthora cactorum]|uniref:Uncharacterized protein n=1 Tax=Phytophthora cactorum TaxID=29920 RepID=A0A8T1TMU7_9STRA|nr:hypothetical protein JG687_00019041 [Phytophthora cactorum]